MNQYQPNNYPSMNQPQANPQATAQLYPNQPYSNQLNTVKPTIATGEEPDNQYTQSMKKRFPFFGIGSLLYAMFYAFCLYKNASGITYPFSSSEPFAISSSLCKS